MDKLYKIEDELDTLLYEIGTDTPLGKRLEEIALLLSRLLTDMTKGKL
jgi:hypothetical protein